MRLRLWQDGLNLANCDVWPLGICLEVERREVTNLNSFFLRPKLTYSLFLVGAVDDGLDAVQSVVEWGLLLCGREAEVFN